MFNSYSINIQINSKITMYYIFIRKGPLTFENVQHKYSIAKSTNGEEGKYANTCEVKHSEMVFYNKEKNQLGLGM